MSFGADDGAVKDLRPNNSITRPKVSYRVEAPLCRIFELSQPNINYSKLYSKFIYD
jgi:hypothetical protein